MHPSAEAGFGEESQSSCFFEDHHSHHETELECIPVDVGINKPFKNRICHQVEQCITENIMSENPPVPLHQIDWIWNGCHAIPANTIVQTWHHIGHEKGMVAPHPDPHLIANNDQHNPLALEEGNVLCTKDDKYCDTDGSMEV